MEKHQLTPENVTESSDSRKRLKVVYRGESNRKGSPEFRRRSPEPEGLRTLETLATAAIGSRLIKKQLNHGKRVEVLSNFTDKNPLLAFTMRYDLNQGTIRVEGDNQTSLPKLSSNLEYDVIHNPNKIVKYWKILLRKSVKTVFKEF